MACPIHDNNFPGPYQAMRREWHETKDDFKPISEGLYPFSTCSHSQTSGLLHNVRSLGQASYPAFIPGLP